MVVGCLLQELQCLLRVNIVRVIGFYHFTMFRITKEHIYIRMVWVVQQRSHILRKSAFPCQYALYLHKRVSERVGRLSM